MVNSTDISSDLFWVDSLGHHLVALVFSTKTGCKFDITNECRGIVT